MAPAAPIVDAGMSAPNAVDVRWASVEHVFAQHGIADGGALRIDLPRRDLVVRVGVDTLSPALALTTSLAFVPDGANALLGVAEIVLRRDEAPVVIAEAKRQGVSVLAVDDALIGETPQIVHAAMAVRGEAATVAAKLRAVVAKSATPVDSAVVAVAPNADWSAMDAILGAHASTMGSTATYTFRRRRDGGSSRAVFQQLGSGRAAAAGAVHVLASEREAVVRALVEHGLHATAVHAHLPDDGSARVWIHWFAIGDGPALARGVAAALARTSP